MIKIRVLQVNGIVIKNLAFGYDLICLDIG